jgi:predicted phage terminase large subunit-like protein
VGFDELTHFEENEFWYLWGRARDATGQVKPYLRATCNPEDCWVANLIKWWLDSKGYPDPEKCGKLRWLVRKDNINYWFNTKLLAEKFIALKGWKTEKPVSVTFIEGHLEDNQLMLRNDPDYYSRLSVLPEEEKSKLLYGCWKFKKAGKLFKYDWFRFYVELPAEPDYIYLTTDTASSIKTSNDYTVMQVWFKFGNKIYLSHQVRGKFTAFQQLDILRSLIIKFKVRMVSIERASSGFSLIDEIKKDVPVLVYEMTRKTDKYTRAKEIQAFVEQGYVYVDRYTDYFSDFINELVAFSPENKNKVKVHDDQVDCVIDACFLAFIEKIGYKDNNLVRSNPLPTIKRKKYG